MIDKRLQQVLDMVKSTTSVPIIIQIGGGIKQGHIDTLKENGMTITKVSNLSDHVYGRANPKTIANKLNAMPCVTKIFYDEPIYSAIAFPQGVPIEKEAVIPLIDAVTHIGAPELWDIGLTGKGVKIGVIDTGISQNHPMFRGKLKGVYSAVPNESVEDHNDHGSWCAGACAGNYVTTPKGRELIGVAPDADLYALKALSNAGMGQTSWVMDCIETAATKFNCDVLSMSLGSMWDGGGVDPISKLVNDVTAKLNKIVVVAAGNSFLPFTIGSPGGAVGALTVGSVAMTMPQKDAPSTFSSKGTTTGMMVKPDISAPGGQLLSPGVSEMIQSAASQERFCSLAGTSMATPQVAGAMALLKQASPELNRGGIEQILACACFPHLKDTVTGYGVLNVARAYEQLGKINPALVDIQNVGTWLQSAAAMPLMSIPRPETEQVQAVRLPAFGA